MSSSNTSPAHPDAIRQPGVPKGDLIRTQFTTTSESVFPGTTRELTVYVPKQYDGLKPACVYVNQDGVQWRAPVVFDNLISRGELPIIVGVFVTSGVSRIEASGAENGNSETAAREQYNRSLEYDGLGDNYALFLLDEVLPFVETLSTPDGRRIKLSKNATDRAIGGASSGAACAFNAAWERPDAFSRVFSAIGSYVALRGGHSWSSLIRKTEPKPIRVFLQDGENDLNIYAGDWWIANVAMERSLRFAGYEVKHDFGKGAHDGDHGALVFPDAMRYLWNGWPKLPAIGNSGNETLKVLLLEGEDWKEIPTGDEKGVIGLASDDEQGFVWGLWRDGRYAVKLSALGTAAAKPTSLPTGVSANLQAFGSNGNRIVADSSNKHIVSISQDGATIVVAEGIAATGLAVTQSGHIFVASPGKIICLSISNSNHPPQTTIIADSQAPLDAHSIALSPDQSRLYLTTSTTHRVHTYLVSSTTGALSNRQEYHHLHAPDTSGSCLARSITCDQEGRTYIATAMGIQVCDQLGRVNAILPLPFPSRPGCSEVVLTSSGELWAVADDGRVWTRKVGVKGTRFDTKVVPPVPRL